MKTSWFAIHHSQLQEPTAPWAVAAAVAALPTSPLPGRDVPQSHAGLAA